MDRYAFVLQSLQSDDYRRLRAFVASGRGEFTTWLVVVVRRLCLDHHRHRYGRPQGESVASAARQSERRNLTDLLGDELALARVASLERDAEAALRMAELRAALLAALERLTVADRLVLRLRFEEGLSVPEIARATSAGSPFRLYRRIDALLRRLRSELTSEGIDDAVP